MIDTEQDPRLAPRAEDTSEQRSARAALAGAVKRRATLRAAYEIAAILDREAAEQRVTVAPALAAYRAIARDAVSRELGLAEDAVREYLDELRARGGAL